MSVSGRLRSKYRRFCSAVLERDELSMRLTHPVVSFTFDDFPASAARIGGQVLTAANCKGTYYVSFGLMGTVAPTGKIFDADDLACIVADGHELGCHTHDHCHAWDTPAAVFAKSISDNQCALERILPGELFRTLSYPISSPKPSIKKVVTGKFLGCRAGGHAPNFEQIDRNAIKSFFLERAKGDVDVVQRLLDSTIEGCGWLLLATHDIAQSPTPYGCTPDFF